MIKQLMYKNCKKIVILLDFSQFIHTINCVSLQ